MKLSEEFSYFRLSNGKIFSFEDNEVKTGYISLLWFDGLPSKIYLIE